jgi:hypothetical protein
VGKEVEVEEEEEGEGDEEERRCMRVRVADSKMIIGLSIKTSLTCSV